MRHSVMRDLGSFGRLKGFEPQFSRLKVVMFLNSVENRSGPRAAKAVCGRSEGGRSVRSDFRRASAFLSVRTGFYNGSLC